jgi:hypothetical protein
MLVKAYTEPDEPRSAPLATRFAPSRLDRFPNETSQFSGLIFGEIVNAACDRESAIECRAVTDRSSAIQEGQYPAYTAEYGTTQQPDGTTAHVYASL